MALPLGTRFGPYDVTARIGAGGMGEVYRARDRTLNRDVALKVLPESLALDPDRVARFKREAQLLASLNHPNIAAIYGFAKTLVSTGGGLQPRWGPDGKELFYVAPDGRLMAVSLRFPGGARTVEPASPVPLFVTRIASTRTGGSGHEYIVSRDGRFLMNTFTERAGSPITLVLNLAPFDD